MTLTNDQVAALLLPLEPHRVQRDGKGYSHVEAWDVRRRMNQVFGFAAWSEDVLRMELIIERQTQTKSGKDAWLVVYRAQCQVAVNGATYTEWAAGDAITPDYGDAHDQAMKTAESQAFKRCCMNLGDQFGLSLYRDGSLDPTVGEIVGTPHADSDKVDGFSESLSGAESWEQLADVVGQIAGAEVSTLERDRLRTDYKQARARLEASLGPEPV